MAAVGVPINGNSVLIYVDDNDGSEVILGSQTGVSFNESRDTIDVTTKANLGTTALRGSKYSATCSASSVYIDDDACFIATRANLENNVKVKLHRYEPQGTQPTAGSEAAPQGWRMADAIITSIGEDFPQDGVGTVSMEFAITGLWVASV